MLLRLAEAGNTVVVEHNLDVWADPDWIIGMGPEGGDAGGRIVAQGSPQELVKTPSTNYGDWLGLPLRSWIFEVSVEIQSLGER